MPFFHVWGRILTKRARTGCGMRLRTTSVASVLAWNTCKDKDMSRMSQTLMQRSSLLLAFAALEIRMLRTNDPDWRSPGRKVGSPYKSWMIKKSPPLRFQCSKLLSKFFPIPIPSSDPQCLALCWDPLLENLTLTFISIIHWRVEDFTQLKTLVTTIYLNLCPLDGSGSFC